MNRRLNGLVSALIVAFFLGACGGGGTSSTIASIPSLPTTSTPPTANTTSVTSLAPMVDGFGNILAEDDFGKGDANASGASGTAAGGAALSNVVVEIIDNAGHKVSGRTDANGVYRLRIDGFVPPLIARVTKDDGTVWHSPAVTQPITRGFINISISGLTDYIAAKVAEAASLSSSAQLTPALLHTNAASLTNAKKELNKLLQQQIQDAGLDPLIFDPVVMVLIANGTGYDGLLDRVLVTNTPNTTTTIVPLKAISGTVVWPDMVVCVTTVTTIGITPCSLTLGLRSEHLPVKYPQNIFSFKTKLPSQTAYSISVINTSPDVASRGGCALSNSHGVVGATDVTNVGVFCR